MLVCVHDCVLMCVFTRWEHKHGHATAKHFSLYFPQGDLLPQWSDQRLTFILYYELILGNIYNSIIMQDIYNIHEHWYPLLVQSHMTGYELISVYVRMYVCTYVSFLVPVHAHHHQLHGDGLRSYLDHPMHTNAYRMHSTSKAPCMLYCTCITFSLYVQVID